MCHKCSYGHRDCGRGGGGEGAEITQPVSGRAGSFTGASRPPAPLRGPQAGMDRVPWFRVQGGIPGTFPPAPSPTPEPPRTQRRQDACQGEEGRGKREAEALFPAPRKTDGSEDLGLGSVQTRALSGATTGWLARSRETEPGLGCPFRAAEVTAASTCRAPACMVTPPPPLPPVVLLFVVSVTHSQPWPGNTKWKCPEIKNW